MKQLYANFQNTLIAIAIVSGVMKNFINAYLLSIDFTLLIVIIFCLDIAYNLLTRKVYFPKNFVFIFFAILCFYILMIFSLVYSLSASYKYEKTIGFVIVCIFFMYPLVVKKFNLDKIINIVKYVAIFLSLFFIYERFRYWLPGNGEARGLKTDNFSVFNVVYLGIGIYLSIVLLYSSFKKKWLTVIFLFLLMLGMGSRGSLVFSLITLLLFHFKSFLNYIFNFKVKRKTLMRKVFVYTGIFIVLNLVLIKYYEKITEVVAIGIGRFESLINISEDKSSLGRIEHYKVALVKIFSSPIRILFGFGIGSFGIITHNQDIRWYPHNIFLEAWFEMGIMGMLLLMIIVLFPFFVKGRIELKAINTFLFLEVMKSSSIIDLRILFLFLGIILVYKEGINLKLDI